MEIEISKNEGLSMMQDQLHTATGERVKDVSLGEFYDKYFTQFPPSSNPK